ncbi:general stress protein [Neobacillus sp. DY30]|uniref:general stress protein n=1 Tax=Neobacillus sp. DY30 TaxID=3047871 RepID=UPI0024C0D2B5|nr:general stress protein [Neobacillus sp. DY30]WHY00515.1 general stress protein [Neobacillus sp. DY30]
MENVKIVENGVQAKKEITDFMMEGFTKDEIYLFAHDENRTEHLTDALDISAVGVGEQGVFESFANVFRSRGDELRSKLESLGLSKAAAERCEEQMDHGKVVVVATKSA